MGKFVITKRSNGDHQFNLQAGNGQVILTSQGYSSRANCENGIESVRKNSQDSNRFVCAVSSNGKHYFNLTATNGQVIGSSQMYESEAGCQNGIASVTNNAPTATIDDQTEG